MLMVTTDMLESLSTFLHASEALRKGGRKGRKLCVRIRDNKGFVLGYRPQPVETALIQAVR